jgi:hypothetical protein
LTLEFPEVREKLIALYSSFPEESHQTILESDLLQVLDVALRRNPSKSFVLLPSLLMKLKGTILEKRISMLENSFKGRLNNNCCVV